MHNSKMAQIMPPHTPTVAVSDDFCLIFFDNHYHPNHTIINRIIAQYRLICKQCLNSKHQSRFLTQKAKPPPVTLNVYTDRGFTIFNLYYSYSTTSTHESRNSLSSSLPLTDCEAATIGIHFCTYCRAVLLLRQNVSRYNLAPDSSPARQKSR